MTKDIKVLDCGCGGSGKVKRGQSYRHERVNGQIVKVNHYSASVHCNKCGANIPTKGFYDDKEKAKEDAIKRWNTIFKKIR